VANSSAKRFTKSNQKTALPTVFLICGFSVGLRANAKAGIWGVFLTMDPQKLISLPSFLKTSKNSTIGEEEQPREFLRQRGLKFGRSTAREFLGNSQEEQGDSPKIRQILENFSSLIVGTTILKRGSSVVPASGRGRAKRSA